MKSWLMGQQRKTAKEANATPLPNIHALFFDGAMKENLERVWASGLVQDLNGLELSLRKVPC